MGEVPHVLKGSRHGHKQKTHTHTHTYYIYIYIYIYIERERERKKERKKIFMWFLDYVHIETIEGWEFIKNYY
jgi:hypothetical protein